MAATDGMEYSKLTDRDQGKADGFVSSLLEDDKYKGGRVIRREGNLIYCDFK